jgi:hypothetical protein
MEFLIQFLQEQRRVFLGQYKKSGGGAEKQ